MCQAEIALPAVMRPPSTQHCPAGIDASTLLECFGKEEKRFSEDMHVIAIAATAKSCNMSTSALYVHQEALQLQEVLNLLDCNITPVKLAIPCSNACVHVTRC